MALAFPDAVRGLHIAAVVDPPLNNRSALLTDEERAYQVQVQAEAIPVRFCRQDAVGRTARRARHPGGQ